MKNRILSVLLALAMMFALAVHASATGEMPPLDGKGSLTIVMSYDGQALEDGKVNILRIGAVEKVSEETYDFRIFSDLGRQTITQEELYDPDVAEELLVKGKKQYMKNILSAPIKDGSVVFKNLDTGLYVVWQEKGDACEGLYAFQPFLISVPRWQYDHYDLNVTAAPKVPLLPEATEPPTTPPATTEPGTPPPSLPLTGQMNWPIPMMAVAGVMLIVIGLILCANRKRNEYEK